MGTASDPAGFTIREATPADRDAALALFRDGRLSEHAESEDPGLDLELLEQTFLEPPESGLWIVESPEGVVAGMVGVRSDGRRAELCRLRVRKEFRGQGLGSMLVRHALEHCRDHAILKVVLDTFVERHDAIALFQKFGFRPDTRPESGRAHRQAFYLDLYHAPES